MEIDGKTHGKVSTARDGGRAEGLRVEDRHGAVEHAAGARELPAEAWSPAETPNRPCVSVCAGAGCLASGASEVIAAFEASSTAQGLEADGRHQGHRLPGLLRAGPVVVLHPEEICYLQVTPEDVPEIVAQTHQGQEGRRAPALRGPGHGRAGGPRGRHPVLQAPGADPALRATSGSTPRASTTTWPSAATRRWPRRSSR